MARGRIEKAIRASLYPGRVLLTPTNGRPFIVEVIDKDGQVLSKEDTGWQTRITWDCLEGIGPFIQSHGGKVFVGHQGTKAGKVNVLHTYLKAYGERPTASWVAVVLAEAGIARILRARPMAVELRPRNQTKLRHVYVVELSDKAGPRRTTTHPNLYVGESISAASCVDDAAATDSGDEDRPWPSAIRDRVDAFSAFSANQMLSSSGCQKTAVRPGPGSGQSQNARRPQDFPAGAISKKCHEPSRVDWRSSNRPRLGVFKDPIGQERIGELSLWQPAPTATLNNDLTKRLIWPHSRCGAVTCG